MDTQEQTKISPPSLISAVIVYNFQAVRNELLNHADNVFVLKQSHTNKRRSNQKIVTYIEISKVIWQCHVYQQVVCHESGYMNMYHITPEDLKGLGITGNDQTGITNIFPCICGPQNYATIKNNN